MGMKTITRNKTFASNPTKNYYCIVTASIFGLAMSQPLVAAGQASSGTPKFKR
jgi:hypothetical protein